MNRLRTAVVVCVMLTAGVARPADEVVFSGPQVGETLPPLRVAAVFGPQAGQEVDLVQQAGDRPALLVIVNGANRPAARLTRALLNYAEMRSAEELFAGLVWLDDDRSGAEQYLRRAISWWGVGMPVGISLEGGEGPGSYGLNRNVNVTVLVAKAGRVVANHALVQPGETDAPKIIGDVTAMIGGAVPTAAEVTFLSLPTRKPANAPWAAAPADVALRRLICDLLAAPDAAAAQTAATALQRTVAGDPKRRAAVSRMAATLSKGRTDVGAIPAAPYLRRWRSQARASVSVENRPDEDRTDEHRPNESRPVEDRPVEDAPAKPAPLPAGEWREHGFTEAQREQIREAFRRGIERQFIPGGSLLIMHKGEVIFREGFGVADIETGRPFSPDALCRIASVTKPHTATVLAILADRGRLSLDDPVDKYLPEFRGLRVRGKGPAGRAPTIAECLSHTTGFPGNNALKAGRVDLRMDGELADVVADLATKPLLAEPGTAYAYSRLGYMTAGRVAEVVTGKPFPEVMQELLLKPIGAVDSRFYREGDDLAGMPVAYDRTPEGFRPRQGDRLGRVINPGGSLLATPDGVARLMFLHRNGGVVDGERIISGETLAAMYVPRPASPGSGYGLGFNIVAKRPDGTASRIRHTGASGTFASLDFDEDLIVVILTQVPQRQTQRWRQNLLRVIQAVVGGVER